MTKMKAGMVGMALMAQSALAAVVVLQQETFDANPGGSYSASGSFSASGFTSGTGNTLVDVDAGATGGNSASGAGSFEGSFAAQGAPAPETGTLTITDPGFLGSYATAYPGYSSFYWRFAFYADVLPADLIISIGNGTDTFLYNVLGQVSAGTWNNVYVPFSGWIGGPGSFPSGDPIAGMNTIALTWSRSGTGAQQYYFDDFTLFGDDSGGGGGGGSAVPEPNTLFLLSMAGVGIVAIRRQVFKGRATA